MKFIFSLLLVLVSFKLLAWEKIPDVNLIQTKIGKKLSPQDGSTCTNCLSDYQSQGFKTWSFDDAIYFIKNTKFEGDNLKILSKQEWGGLPRKTKCRYCKKIPLVDPTVIVIHETATENAPAIDQSYHQNDKQWADIGYHYIIAKKDGVWAIHEGSSLEYIGTHAGQLKKNSGESKKNYKKREAEFNQRTAGLGLKKDGLNSKTIAVAIQGNFDVKSAWNPRGYPKNSSEANRQPPPMVVQLLGNLILKLKTQFPTVKRIMTHSAGPDGLNIGEKECSGIGTFHIVSSLRERFNL